MEAGHAHVEDPVDVVTHDRGTDRGFLGDRQIRRSGGDDGNGPPAAGGVRRGTGDRPGDWRKNCVGDACKPDATVNITVDGAAYTRNPRDIALRDGTEIKIAIS